MFLPITARTSYTELTRRLVWVEDIRQIVEYTDNAAEIKTLVYLKDGDDPLFCQDDFDTLSSQLASQYMLLALPQVGEKRKNETEAP